MQNIKLQHQLHIGTYILYTVLSHTDLPP